MSEPTLEAAPDLIEPVIGFRQWRLVGDSLRSLTCDEVWLDAYKEARCHLHTARAAPVGDCTCGVHAWYEPPPRTASTAQYVAGAVILWGAIELHVTGMRAQFCRIVGLALPLSRWGKRERLLAAARGLGVAVVPSRQLRAVANRHGSAVPSALRPPREWLPSPYARAGFVPQAVEAARLRLTGTA
jgi:hypothetical protein